MDNLEKVVAKALVPLYFSYGLVYLLTFNAVTIFAICLCSSLIVTIGIIVRKHLVLLSITSMYFIIFGCSLYSGGVKSPILFWLFSVQTTSAFYGLSSKRQFLICMSALLMFIMLTSVVPFKNEVDAEYIDFIHIIAIIGISTYSFLISSYFIKTEKIKNENLAFAREIGTMQSIIKGINHEFGNVLNVFFSGIRSIKVQLGKGDLSRVNQLIENLQKSAEHANHIVKSFRNVDALRSDEKVHFKLFDLVETVTSLTKGQYMERMQIVNSVAKEVELTCNQSIVFQCVLNAFSNCVKADPTEVEFSAYVDDTFCHLSIKDNGKGISQDSGFDPFKAGDSKFNSTGLGLAISREKMRSFGGDIFVESKGNPTIFTIKIPKNER